MKIKKIIVIGGGPGGYAAALYAAHLEMDVTLIEKERLGGTCLNVGCIPTKVFVQAADMYAQIGALSRYGISVPGAAGIDFDKTAKLKRKITNQLRGGVASLLKKAGVHVITGVGVLKDKNTVEVMTNETIELLKADDIVIATGSREITVPGLETNGVSVLNSTQMLDIRQLPERIVIIGGGVIGVEFASIFSRFGKTVTIIEMSGSLIPSEDMEIAQSLREMLEKQGVRIMTNARARKIDKNPAGDVTLKIKTAADEEIDITADQVLVCVGRRANLEGIGLEEVGISVYNKTIYTNSRMQTNIPNIYAVGDVTDSPQLAHVAYHEARVAALTIAGRKARADYHAIPGCIYAHPEVASVGMTEEEARNKLKSVVIHKESFAGNGKALIEGETDGYMKMILDGGSGRAVGFSIIGPKATELIAEPTLVVQANFSVADIARCINAHPSLSELIGEVAGSAAGLRLHS